MADQALKRNVAQYGPVGSELSSKPSQFENLSLSKEEDSSAKKSSIHVTQPTPDDHCFRVSDIESGGEPYVPSHKSQTLKPQIPNQGSQAPVTVSWAPVNGSNALSFTFTVTLPKGVNEPQGSSQNPLHIATSLLNNGGHCTVNLPNSQATDASGPFRMPNNQSDSDGCLSRTTSPTVPASTVNPTPREEDRPYRARPRNTDRVQWYALPTSSGHQPQPSSSRAPEQTQASLANKYQMSDITLHSPEQSSDVFGAFAAPVQRGMSIRIKRSSCIISTIITLSHTKQTEILIF